MKCVETIGGKWRIHKKNRLITRASCEEFVGVIVSHTKYWAYVARDRKGAVRFK